MNTQMLNDREWQDTTLGEVAAEVTVGYVGPMADQYVASGVLFLRSLNVEPFRLDLHEVKYIGEEFHRKLQKSSLAPGDVVIVRTGKPGAAVVIPESLPVANCSDLVVVRPGPQLDPRFLVYYINSSARHHVSAYTVGAVQQHFNISSAKEMRLNLPPLWEQRAIARILGALDDKIELNRRMNRTLEAMARAIFKSWFVDFDPVIAKAEGRQPYGMNVETAALFPSAFQDSELGPIPKGWKVGSLRNLFPDEKDYVLTGPFGSHLHAHDYRDEGVPLILVKHVNDGKISEDDMPLVGMHKVPQMERYRLRVGDIVFTRVGAVGRSAYVHPQQEGWLISGQMLRVRVPDKGLLNSRYLAQVYLEPSFTDMVGQFALGTTRPSLNTSILQSFKFLVPPIELQQAFARIAGILDRRIQHNYSESRTLTAIRDALLPKLLSGEIRVKPLESKLAQPPVG
jgi:type I restriction enzyme, S subunit